jgi:glucose-6-phosphate 1-epimerase
VLFVSSRSTWKDGKAIRGGVPICFPWFGDKLDDPKAPAHGFVRTKSWQLDAIDRSADAVIVSMSTSSDETTKQWWPADFRLVYRAAFGSELALELELHNTGVAPLRFEEALHAYFDIRDVRNARVNLDTQSAVELLDPVSRRSIHIAKENSRTTVIWNPWADKARAMSDLGDEEWTQMLCIETSNVLDYAATLAPGQQHRMKAVVRAAALKHILTSVQEVNHLLRQYAQMRKMFKSMGKTSFARLLAAMKMPGM